MKDIVFLRLLNIERLLKEVFSREEFIIKYEYNSKKEKWNVLIPFLFFRKHYKFINFIYESDNFLLENYRYWELIENLPYIDNESKEAR